MPKTALDKRVVTYSARFSAPRLDECIESPARICCRAKTRAFNARKQWLQRTGHGSIKLLQIAAYRPAAAREGFFTPRRGCTKCTQRDRWWSVLVRIGVTELLGDRRTEGGTGRGADGAGDRADHRA